MDAGIYFEENVFRFYWAWVVVVEKKPKYP
jgi:hypothetical protein